MSLGGLGGSKLPVPHSTLNLYVYKLDQLIGGEMHEAVELMYVPLNPKP